MKLNSIRFKASVLYSFILALILLAFGAFIYGTVHAILYHDLDEDLKVKAEEITTILYAYEKIERSSDQAENGVIGMIRDDKAFSTEKTVIDDLWRSQLEVLNLKHDLINILNVRGRTVLRSDNFKDDIARFFGERFPFAVDRTVYKTLKNADYQVRAINLPIRLFDTQLVIQVGTPTAFAHRILDRLLVIMIWASVILLLATSFIGGYFASKALRPVGQVVDLANRITHKDLSSRIKEKDVDQEMKELVKSFNVMIERLETSFGHINEFSSHAAHELKTPLAILRGEIELALEQDKTSDEYKRVLNECLTEIDRMIKVVKDLLLLAKLDYNPEVFHFEKMDLVPLLNEIAEQSKILAEPKQIAMTFQLPAGRVMVNADRVHIRRLFHNIIGNAIKHIPSRRTINVAVQIRDGRCVVDVADTGDGISEENLQKIFQKFFRVHNDEGTAEPGTGLGLSIAMSIARAHGGDIQVKSCLLQGTTFSIFLPIV